MGSSIESKTRLAPVAVTSGEPEVAISTPPPAPMAPVDPSALPVGSGACPAATAKQLANIEAGDWLVAGARFWWGNADPTSWAGFTRRDLCQLVRRVSALLGISAAQAEKIRITFADHCGVDRPSRPTHYNTACCIVDWEDQGITGCRVIINRSKELCDHACARDDSEEEERLQKEGLLAKDAECLKCVFEEPWENIAWILAEELKHAKNALVAGNDATHQRWQARYHKALKDLGRLGARAYDVDIDELSAARAALMVLEYLARDRAPHRVSYFSELRQESRRSGRAAVPTIGKIFEALYVRTGFKPDSKA